MRSRARSMTLALFTGRRRFRALPCPPAGGSICPWPLRPSPPAPPGPSSSGCNSACRLSNSAPSLSRYRLPTRFWDLRACCVVVAVSVCGGVWPESRQGAAGPGEVGGLAGRESSGWVLRLALLLLLLLLVDVGLVSSPVVVWSLGVNRDPPAPVCDLVWRGIAMGSSVSLWLCDRGGDVVSVSWHWANTSRGPVPGASASCRGWFREASRSRSGAAVSGHVAVPRRVAVSCSLGFAVEVLCVAVSYAKPPCSVSGGEERPDEEKETCAGMASGELSSGLFIRQSILARSRCCAQRLDGSNLGQEISTVDRDEALGNRGLGAVVDHLILLFSSGLPLFVRKVVSTNRHIASLVSLTPCQLKAPCRWNCCRPEAEPPGAWPEAACRIADHCCHPNHNSHHYQRSNFRLGNANRREYLDCTTPSSTIVCDAPMRAWGGGGGGGVRFKFKTTRRKQVCFFR
jgi:hypothetical protein